MAIALALLVSADPVTIQQFNHALKELSISSDVCQDAANAVLLLNRRKFDAVTNHFAMPFAVSGSDAEVTAAFRKKAAFVFERPLSTQSIRSTLKPAYGMILRERRRYFRCPISIPITILRQSMPEVRCYSVNISEGGMAVSMFVPLSAGEPVQVQFTLPGHKMLLAESRICWLKSGRLGVRFVSLSPESKSELQGWLSRKLEETLPESVACQFREAETSSLAPLAGTKQD
jgi:PilZ domain